MVMNDGDVQTPLAGGGGTQEEQALKRGRNQVWYRKSYFENYDHTYDDNKDEDDDDENDNNDENDKQSLKRRRSQV